MWSIPGPICIPVGLADSRCHNAAMAALGRASLWQQVLEELGVLGAGGTLVSWNTAITACAEAAEWSSALQLLSQLSSRKPSSGFRADRLSFNAALTACRNAGRWREVLLLLTSMAAAGQVPDDSTLSTVTAACERAGLPERGLRLFMQLTREGASAAAPAYNAALKSASSVLLWREFRRPAWRLEPMSSCIFGKPRTPLDIYGRSLPNDADATPVLFPMYTVAADVLLKMTRVEPHEMLKARGELVVFSDDLGKAAFVSHQWLSKDHPDPDFKQMRTLQSALKRILNSSGSVSLDFVTECLVQAAKPLPMQDFQVQTLYFWYDYFSCPQLAGQGNVYDHNQASAISSIPSYISACQFFFALCPVLECPLQGKVLTAATWSSRGWCRLERAARELSANSAWILIQSDASIEVVGTVLSFPSGIVGEGDFGKVEDREKLAPVMRQILINKLHRCLREGDLPGFRRHFNLQTVHLRGLEIDPVPGLLPSREAPGDVVAEFLHQNGLRRVGEADSAGWRPLHYAALAGNAEVLRGLLEQRADVNRRTSKDEPMLGFPPWMSALDLSVFYKHHQATRLLLTARAHLEGGVGPAVFVASSTDNAEAIRLLCAAGANPLGRDIIGPTVLQCAAGNGAAAALEELLVQGRPGSLDLSRALFDAAFFRGGSAELVQRLIGLRADVDFQMNVARDFKVLGRLMFAGKSLQYRLGRATTLTTLAYHLHGSTPLMQSIRSAQFEAAAALIAAGARLDLRNSRNWTAADFARGQSIPHFLQLGLEGDPSECRKLSSLAIPDGYVEVLSLLSEMTSKDVARSRLACRALLRACAERPLSAASVLPFFRDALSEAELRQFAESLERQIQRVPVLPGGVNFSRSISWRKFPSLDLLEIRDLVPDFDRKAADLSPIFSAAAALGARVGHLGSAAEGLGTEDSDIDVTILTEEFAVAGPVPFEESRDFQRRLLRKVRGLLVQVPGVEILGFISEAKRPLLRMILPCGKKADVSAENREGCQKSAFIARHLHIGHPMLARSCLCLKTWAQRRGVYGQQDGFPSGLGFSCMAIFAAQCFEPTVAGQVGEVPDLIHMSHVNDLRQRDATTDEDVFDWDTEQVSPRRGHRQARRALTADGVLSIEDPVLPDLDLARPYMNLERSRQLHRHFTATAGLLTKGQWNTAFNP
eukprot:s1911_g3.t7